jgi:uncharacterized protein (DUF1330 family)
MGYIELPMEQLKTLVGESPHGSIVMVNLLRFKGEAGRASYLRYLEHVEPLMTQRGCRFVYWGEAKTTVIGPEQWDMVVLGEYPNRTVLLQMLASEEYAAIAHYRQEALEDSRLILTEAVAR